MERIHLNVHLTTPVLKHLNQGRISLKDLEGVDPGLYESLLYVQNESPDELELSFVFPVDDFGQRSEIPLKENGQHIIVTDANKEEYVKLYVDFRLKEAAKEQLRAFCDGFSSLIPLKELRIFTASEIDLLICGTPEIDIADFEEHCEIESPYTKDHPTVKLFFKAISQWSSEWKAKLLFFMTGSSQVPVNGFRALAAMGNPLKIARFPGKTALPVAHTCHNQLDLPEYTDIDELNSKFGLAIHECGTFQFI
jgi:hypothetical protein